MELLQLRYFKELAESEHLSNTAKKLMISPPSLSLTISKLESELGVPLFDRSGRHLQLNDYGKIYYKYISKGLSSIDKGSQEITECLKFVESTLNLAIASPLIWEDCLDAFRQTYGYIAVNVDTTFPEKILLPEEWKYDFFIGITREIDMDFFQYRTLRKEEMPVVLISKNNPLAEFKNLDFRQLKNECFISLYDLSPTAHKFILDMCSLSNFKPKKMLKANYFTRMKYLEENKGIVLTTELGVAKNSISTESFSIVPITFPTLTRQQAIAWEKDSDISVAGNLFLDFILQYCIEHPDLS